MHPEFFIPSFPVKLFGNEKVPGGNETTCLPPAAFQVMRLARPPISECFQVRLAYHQRVPVLFQEEAYLRGGGGVAEECDV